MSKFVLTAQLQLQAPGNVKQIVQQIQSQLNGVNVNVQVQNAGQAQKQLQQVTQQAHQATTAAERMGKAFALSIRRFAAFSIATRAVGLFTSNLSSAVESAIDFERELIKIAQVTGKTVGQLRGLTKQITSLSTGFGVASSDLLEVSTVLAQAGLTADDTAVALRTLAKAALAPNFDSISETAEGAIAILAQFGKGVEALESQLGSINAVAGAFAVEASDLIDVVRRTGGVFKASGGDLNELLALFTSVRATTRESAESIGTGLRTIFTRIQRPKTIEYLKQFGVELTDLNGKFIGPYEAIKKLSEALSGLGEGDITFIRIAEELGGFRQIGKVLPLLQQFSTAQSALNVAMKAGDSLTQDAASAQAALAIRIMKVKEEFLALVRSVTETSTFQVMANTALSLASALIKIGDSIKPLLPMLAALAGFKLVKGMAGFFGGMMSGAASGRTYNTGGKVLGFARGGMVPGSGNGDTVPAMLSPGEFVIRKSSVKKLGANSLAAMNENRFALGGQARKFGVASLSPMDGQPQEVKTEIPVSNIRQYLSKKAGGKNIVKRGNLENVDNTIRGILGLKGQQSINTSAVSETISRQDVAAKIEKRVELSIQKLIDNSASSLGKSLSISVDRKADNSIVKSVGSASTIGSVFEGALAMLGAPMDSNKREQDPMDFPNGLGPKFASSFQSLVGIPVDAKKRASKDILQDTAYRKASAYLANAVYADPRWKSLSANQAVAKSKTWTDMRSGEYADYKSLGYKSFAEARGSMPDTFEAANRGGKKVFLRRAFGGLIQKFATGSKVNAPSEDTVLRGGIKYSKSDIMRSMAGIGLTYDDFFKTIPVPVPIGARGKPGDFGTQLMVGGFGQGSVPMPKNLKPFTAAPSAAMQGFLNKGGRNLDQNMVAPESYKRGYHRRYATGGAVDTLESFYKDSSSINLGLANSRSLGKDQRKALASNIQDLRSLRSQAPSQLFSSISRVAFDKMASQVGLNKNPNIPEGTRLFDRAKYYAQAVEKIVGKNFSLPGFVSTSKDAGVAKSFLDNAPRSDDKWAAMLTILTKQNAQGVDVAGKLQGRNINQTKQEINPRTGKMETFSMNQPGSESEFALSPRSRFKINSAKYAEMLGRHNLWMNVQQYAKGGDVGTDTVPALLTPGEFVVNRSSAQRIGYGNLNRMNKVGRYANGGVVQHFAAGGKAGSSGSGDTSKGFDSLSSGLFGLSMVLSMVTPQIDEKSSTLVRVISNLMGTFTTLIATVATVQLSLAAFGMQLSLKNIGEGLSKIKNLFSGGKGGLGDVIAGVTKRTGLGGKTASVRAAGENVGEAFLNARRSDRITRNIGRARADISQLPIKDRLGPIDPLQQQTRDMYAQQLRRLRANKANLPIPKSFTGQLGSRLGQLSTKGGLVGRAAGMATNVITRVGGSSAAQGALSILPNVAQFFGKLLPVIGTLVTAFTFLKSATDALAGRFKQDKENQIKAGNVEEAVKAARMESSFSSGGTGAAIGGVAGGIIGSFFGPVVGTAIGASIGASLGGLLSDPFGNLQKEATSLAAAQAGEVRAAKALEAANTEGARAMIDFKNGAKSALDVLNAYGTGAKEQQIQRGRADESIADITKGKSRGAFRLGRNIIARLGGGLFGMELATTRNKRLTEEGIAVAKNRREAETKFSADTLEARNAAIRTSFFNGATREQTDEMLKSKHFDTVSSLQTRAAGLREQQKKAFESGDQKLAEELGLSATDLENRAKDLEQAFVNIQREVISAKEKFAALNLGFRSVTSASDAAALKMDNLMNSFEVGNLPATRAAATLEASLTSAGQNIKKIDFDSALNEVNGVFKAFGASQEQIDKFNGLLQGVAGVQREFPSIFDTLKKELLSGELKDINNPTLVGNKFKEIVGRQLEASGIDKAAREQILAAMGDVKIDPEDVQKLLGPAPDYSVLEKYIGDAAEEVKKNMKSVIDNYAKVNQQLIEITKKRIDAERNLVEAQKEALDLIMEGRDVEAKYGGREVTLQERRQNLLSKSNVEGSRLGLANLRTGDAGELRRRNLQIMGGFANVEEGRRRNGLENVKGAVSNEYQKDLEKSYKTQIDTIRNLIKLEEDQLKITEEKNKLEKESLESLIKGDVESFFKQQAAVGAKAAIASGDQRLMNLYGSEAIGTAASDIQRQKDAGVQSLYGQRLGGAGGLAESAAAAALSSMGINDMRSAQVLAGTTGEEEANKARLRELGGLLGETGQIGVQMAEMQVGTATIQAEKAELIVTNLANGGNTPPQNRAHGGLIYASRGAFISRGTDTVPAMLTPGEFVVNRAAVQRGNNLQMLRAMNGGGNSSSSSQSAGMSNGGVVKYFQKGGQAETNQGTPINSFDNQIMNKFADSLVNFNRNLTANIDKLKQTSINIKLDSTNVNINLNDGGLLRALKEEVKKELLIVISNQFKLDNNGNIRRNQTILG